MQGVYFLDIYITLDITLQHLCSFQPSRLTVAVWPMNSIFVDVQHKQHHELASVPVGGDYPVELEL